MFKGIKWAYCACALLLGMSALPAQVEGVTRKAMEIHKRPLNRVPNLSIVDRSIRFEDANRNGVIDADEEATLFFSLNNAASASGAAEETVCEVRVEGTSFGISIPERMGLGTIPIGSTLEFSLPIRSEMNTKDGEVTFYLKVRDRFGVGTRETSVSLNTLAFRTPDVLVVDSRVRQGVIERRVTFDYDFMVQNKGDGFAYDVRCELEFVDEGVHPVSQHSFKFERMAPGEVREVSVGLTVQDDYRHKEIRFNVLLRESFGRYAETFVEALPLDAPMEQTYRPLGAEVQSGQGGGVAFYGSDVDRDIPMGKRVHANRFALLIGNEDYVSNNPGLSRTQNVPFAESDARVMKKYFQQLWGVPEENTILEINAGKVDMERALAKLSNFASALDGDAELIFYYSGHGLPSEETKEPYLIPVDVDGDDPERGVSLEEVYAELGKNPTQRTTVFLDACFSGGARDGSLIAGMKGLTRVPEEVEAGGRAVVFASSSGSQSSGVYEDQEHGYFTYFLLKYMQELKGRLEYGDLFEFVKKEVRLQSTREGKDQEPTVKVAPSVIDEWRNWGIDD